MSNSIQLEKIETRTILDSTGRETIEISLTSKGREVCASVPQGESRGKHEAVALPVEDAIQKIKEISPTLFSKTFADQNDFDQSLIELDGTPNKSNLGGNTLLALSIGFARLLALEKGKFLWRFLKEISGSDGIIKPPRLLALMIEGGLHAPEGSPFQEYLVSPRQDKVKDSVQIITRLYQSLKEIILNKFGGGAIRLGDEGAYAPNESDPLLPFEWITVAVEAIGAKSNLDYGLDAAADNVEWNLDKLQDFYREISLAYPIFYLEDPFNEESWEAFADLLSETGGKIMITGDDLTVTNISRLKLAKERGSINAVIIKPNQIGTITETLEAVKFAKDNNWKVVVSHRGRETNDDFIADLAWGVGADFIKLGAPARGERVAKYNRLLQIEEKELEK